MENKESNNEVNDMIISIITINYNNIEKFANKIENSMEYANQIAKEMK